MLLAPTSSARPEKYRSKPYIVRPRIPLNMQRRVPLLWVAFRQPESFDNTDYDHTTGRVITCDVGSGAIGKSIHTNVRGSLAAGNDGSNLGEFFAFQSLDFPTPLGPASFLFSGVFVHSYVKTRFFIMLPGNVYNSNHMVIQLTDTGNTAPRPAMFTPTSGWQNFPNFTTDSNPAGTLFNIGYAHDGNGNWTCSVYNVSNGYSETGSLSVVMPPDIPPPYVVGRRWDIADNLCPWEIEEHVVLGSQLSQADLEDWARDPYGFWSETSQPRWALFNQEAPPGDDQIVTLGNAPQASNDAAVPTVTAEDNQIITLGNAPQASNDAAVPTIDARVEYISLLANGAQISNDAAVPSVDARVEHEVTLGNASQLSADAGVPTVQSGENAIITLGNAPDLVADAAVPTVIGKLVQEITLGNAPDLVANAAVPQVEGVSDLPPTIETPTADQIYTFGLSGTLPAPPHTIGTGDNPTWSMPVDNFGNKAGVMTWSINPTTGDITYQINQLSGDPDEQALNTKGPYAVTRRLTTTVGNADESFDVMVNIGNYTLQMTPGTKPCYTWTTKTAAARGLEPTKDPSARVTQTYTVT